VRSERRSNKSLELSPGVGIESDAIILNSGGERAQVGGAAQLYVRWTKRVSLVFAASAAVGSYGRARRQDMETMSIYEDVDACGCQSATPESDSAKYTICIQLRTKKQKHSPDASLCGSRSIIQLPISQGDTILLDRPWAWHGDC